MEFTVGVLICIILVLAIAYYFQLGHSCPPCACPTCAAAVTSGSKQEKFCGACAL